LCVAVACSGLGVVRGELGALVKVMKVREVTFTLRYRTTLVTLAS
jgi:hypothetical protein